MELKKKKKLKRIKQSTIYLPYRSTGIVKDVFPAIPFMRHVYFSPLATEFTWKIFARLYLNVRNTFDSLRIAFLPDVLSSVISFCRGVGNAEIVQLKVVCSPGFTRLFLKSTILGGVTVSLARLFRFDDL